MRKAKRQANIAYYENQGLSTEEATYKADPKYAGIKYGHGRKKENETAVTKPVEKEA